MKSGYQYQDGKDAIDRHEQQGVTTSNELAADGGSSPWTTVSKRRNRRKQSPPQAPPFLLLLVGIPGSGKSHFAQALAKTAPSWFVRVNQDTLKTRQRCESKTREILSCGRCPIIDRCNFNQEQRQYFVEIAQHFKVEVDCVVLFVDKEECIRRCQNRDTHETVSPEKARMVVECIKRQFVFPPPNEGFRTVTTISTHEQANALIKEYAAS